MMKFLFLFFAFIFHVQADDFLNLNSKNSLSAFIAKNRITSIDDFLAKLPHDLRRRYTLVYKSRALGKASPEFPRILLSGDKNLLTLSIGTRKDDPLYHSLEFMEYNEQEKNFHFFVIHFHESPLYQSDGSDLGTSFRFVYDDTDAPRISSADPKRCLNCHHKTSYGVNTPIWDVYPMWPGVYGSTHDQYTFSNEATPEGGYALLEQKAYAKYLRPFIGKGEGRFGKLLPLHHEKEKNRFRSGLGVNSNFDRLTNQSNVHVLKKHLQKKGILLEQAKYFLFYATTCLAENNMSPGSYTLQRLKEDMLGFTTPELFSRMVVTYADKNDLSLASEEVVLNHLKEKIRTSLRSRQLQIFERVVSDMNTIADYMGEPQVTKHDLVQVMRDYGAGEGEGTSPDEFRLDNYQWPHIMMLMLYLDAIDFPLERWMYDRSILGYYNNSGNMPYSLSEELSLQMDFDKTDPAFNTFLQSRHIYPWPMITDFSILGIRPTGNPQVGETFKRFCADVVKTKSLLLTSY